jgi:hypothetical protein
VAKEEPAVIDTLELSRDLAAAGAEQRLADAIARAIAKGRKSESDAFRLADLATKADLAEVRGEVKDLRSELREEVLKLERRIDGVEKIDTLGKSLTIRLGWMIAAAVGLTATLVKLL